MKSSDCWEAAYKLIRAGEKEKAIELCEMEPCSSVLECQRYLGWTYYEFDNISAALSWFQKATERGDADALFGIASCHFVQRDFPLALQYYRLASERGCSRAYHWIAYIYQCGLGLPRNLEMARDYYERSVAHGYVVAERALLHLAFKHGNLLDKILVLPKFVLMLMKAAKIAYHDGNDPRIVDVPNAFERKVTRTRQ